MRRLLERNEGNCYSCKKSAQERCKTIYLQVKKIMVEEPKKSHPVHAGHQEENAEKPARPAQPHPATLRQLVEARINKRHYVDEAMANRGPDAPSTTAATTLSAAGTATKKYRTVGYLPGGVPINEPITLEIADLAKQAEAMAQNATSDNVKSYVSSTQKVMLATAVLPSSQKALLTKTGDSMAAVQSLLEASEETADVSLNAAGFTCGVCHVLLKDYTSYLNHLNSKGHLKATGQSLRLLAPVSVRQVQEKLEALKQQREEAQVNCLNGPEKALERMQEEAKARWETIERGAEAERQAEKAAKKAKKMALKEMQQRQPCGRIETLDEELADGLKEAGFDFTAFGGSRP
jgi:hypothetical protein